MTSSEDLAASRLSSQAELMNLAMESVGSEHTAKLLLANKIKDAILLKFKVTVETRLGILIVLVSTYSKKILYVYSIAGTTQTLQRANAYEDNQRFIYNFVQIGNEEGVESELSELIGRAAHYALSEEIVTQLIPYWENNNIEETLPHLKEKIKELSTASKIEIQGDLERVSSIPLRSNNRLAGIVKPIFPPTAVATPSEEKAPEPKTAKVPENPEEYLKAFASKYRGVLKVKTIIAPFDGLSFNELNDNDVIFFKPIGHTKEQKELAEQATGSSASIVEGKFLQLFITPEEEYHLFTLGPEKTLLYSVDTKDLKIRTERKQATQSTTIESSESSGFSISPTLIVGLFMICVAVGLAYLL